MKILVVKLSSLGDIAQALPAVRRLAERTGGEIHWLLQPEYAPLVEALPFVSRVLVWPRHGGIWTRAKAVKELRRERYDAVLDLQGLLKSALPATLARRTKGARKYGMSPPAAREQVLAAAQQAGFGVGAVPATSVMSYSDVFPSSIRKYAVRA